MKRKRYHRLAPSANGMGVWALSGIPFGAEIARFDGELIPRMCVPTDCHGPEDRYIQVGPDQFRRTLGEVDQWANHSCDPNAGLRFEGGIPVLVAIRDIEPGEQITYDYSSTIWADTWTMSCGCGSSRCRKVIGEFQALPEEVKARYRALGIVPSYVDAPKPVRA